MASESVCVYLQIFTMKGKVFELDRNQCSHIKEMTSKLK